MTNCRAGVHLVLLLLCIPGSASTAQAPQDCTYSSCALRLRYGFFSHQLVQGQDQRRVASLGLFAPTVPLFAERSDTAARYYASFRRRHNSSVLLGLAGTAALAAGLLVHDSDGDAGVVLVIGAGLLGFGGAIQGVRAQDQLSQAVWWYNRTFAPSP